jgi:NAD-dependent SIR2 family protein deacetylase
MIAIDAPPLPDLAALAHLVRASRRLVVLTGAGCSTESGIPDYRGPDGRWRSPSRPVQYLDFVRRPEIRARYWARSMTGWPAFRAARPNDGHRALAALERRERVGALITQNVDRLHQAAGSRRVVELHGALHEVVCLECRQLTARDDLQARLLALNPTFAGRPGALAPDGDAAIATEDLASFRVPPCVACGGVLKPRVVFFGENVPPAVVEAAFGALAEADALLVAGSSLTVWSGFRFARAAHERGVPVAIVNLGPTRADALAAVRVDARVGDVLPALAEQV